MNDSLSLDGIYVNYVGYENTPDCAGCYMSFIVTVKIGKYSGESSFYLASSRLEVFVEELKLFYKSFSGKVKIEAGWGDTPLLELTFSPYDLHGNILTECILQDRWTEMLCNRVQVFQLIYLSQIQELASFFEQIVTAKSSDSYMLLAHF